MKEEEEPTARFLLLRRGYPVSIAGRSLIVQPLSEVEPDRYCLPRQHSHSRPSFLEVTSIT